MSSDVKVLQPTGILDSVHGNQLRRSIGDLLEANNLNVLIDCQNVEFMDSSGLSCLIMTLKNVRAAGGNMALCNINGQLKLLLELTAMEDVFKVYDSVESFSESIFACQ